MQEALAVRSDPQTAIAIPEQPIGLEQPSAAWKGIRLGFSVNELSDSTLNGDQECAVVAFNQSFGGAHARVWQRIELRRTRLPSPQPRRRSHPEIASYIFIQ